MVLEIPGKKDTVVDVRCKDSLGRQFIVEMQMHWNENFMMSIIDEQVIRETFYKDGRTDERLANARSLKANNVPLDVIAKSLNLSLEEIEKL